MTVTVSEPLFDWVIENLLKNAVDAMGGEGTVLFHISERRGKVLLDISDTGKGVPKSQFKTLFIPDSPPRSVVGDLACRL